MLYRKLPALIIILLAFSNTAAVIATGNSGGDIVVYTLKYTLETETVEIEAGIPVLEGLQDKTTQEDFNRYLRDVVIRYTDDIKKHGDQSLRKQISEGHPVFKYQAYVCYELKSKEKVLSLYMSFYQYTGGAHGLTGVFTYNLDPATGRLLTFQDILEQYSLELADIKDSIINELNKEPGLYFSDTGEYIKNKDEFDFYIEDNHLVIFFQQYEIAPYVVGIPEFKIPLY
ncbi:MAG: DUF3298 and DUF4163 domain-containing protein [Halanaerobiaceae bacterium]|nr:DUF3298 and DUF4163 domain-containing protein [Halanaerobiaceae bacterium]